MNDVFLVVLSLSLSGSVLALLLFALRPLVGMRLSKSWQYYIWLVVLLRFLLPFTPQTSAAGELTRAMQSTAATTQSALLPGDAQAGGAIASGGAPHPAGAGDGVEPAAGPGYAPQAGAGAVVGAAPELPAFAWVAWLGVALVLFAFKAATYRSFSHFARAGAVEVTQGRLRDLYLDELAIGNIKRPPPLYINDLVSSPMLVGLSRPAIILPTLVIDDDGLRHILRHELTHYKRLDGLYKWLAQVVLCLHWFNPFAYAVARQLGKACELACDEAVLKGMDAGGRMCYGDALIASLKAQGSYGSGVVSITMSEDAGAVRERLDAIAGYRGKSAWARGGSAALTALLLCGFAFTGAYRAADPVAPAGVSAAAAAGERDSGVSTGMPRGTGQTPEDLEIVTARAGAPVAAQGNVEIVIADNAAVDLVPTSSDAISVDYGDQLYEVSIEQKNGDWRIWIAYTGSDSVYPAATLRLPDILYGNVDVYAQQATVYFDGVFRGGAVNAHLEDCTVFYTVPAGFTGTLSAIAPGSYFQLGSEDGYQNCAVAVANCDTFGSIADGFSMRDGYLVYSNGTGAGVVRVDMAQAGYFTVESSSYSLPSGTVGDPDGNAGGLSLVVHEYTVAQLREGNICGVKVAAASERVRVTTGGQTLKLQFYQAGSGDYTLETVSDRGGTIQELYLLRDASSLDGTDRTIHITIPESFDCDVLHITTSDGGISLDGCRANTVMLQTQSGEIRMDDGAVEGYLSAASAGGGIHIAGVSLPEGDFSNNLQTESGAVRLLLPGPVGAYTFKIDAGSGARVLIGGESHSGGNAYTVGSGAAGTIKFTSGSGSLIVEDV